jgi:hypothetical protein
MANPLMKAVDKVYEIAKGKPSTKASDSLRNTRMAKCFNCPLHTKIGTCGDGLTQGCGCVVKLKTQYAEESCPEGKW